MSAFETPEAAIAAAGGTTERYGPDRHNAQFAAEEVDARSRWGDETKGPLSAESVRHDLDHSHYTLVDPTTLFGRAIPARRWIVEDWLPIGHATALYGDGGTGKTLLAQQLMTSCAAKKPWCGLDVAHCRTLGLFCEDSEEELHRRQDRINDSLGVTFDKLGAMRWISGVGVDNILMTFDHRGRGQLTERYREIVTRSKEFGAQLVVIDTAADVYAGDENVRSQVRQFIGQALNALAIAIGGAVLLNAHPSRAGMSSSGDMGSGSTAWSNTVRSRWSLMRPKADDGAEADTDERVLTRRKANYAAAGETIRLRWVNGMLAPVALDGAAQGVGSRQAVEMVFLALLARCEAQGVFVSNSKNAGNFVGKVFSKRPDREGYRASDFEQAMHRLFAANQIEMQVYDRQGHRKIVRAPEAEKPA